MILFNQLGQELFQEQEIVHKFLKKLMKIYLLQVVIMVQVLELELYLVNKLQLKQVMKIQKKLKLLKLRNKPNLVTTTTFFKFRC